MSATQFLVNATTRHAIFVERYGHGRFNDLEPILDDMRGKLVVSLQRANITAFEMNRLNALLLDIDQILADSLGQMSLDLLDEVFSFGSDELRFNSRMLQKAISPDVAIPAIDQLSASLDDVPMVLSRASGAAQEMTISQAISQFSQSNASQVRSLIQQGFISGETTDQITRKVIKRVDGRTKAQARALTSTVISASSNKAHAEVAKANEDVLRGEQIIATLDTLTSDICISADKTVWPVGKGPQCPLHFNCRSLRVMLVKDEYALPGLGGERASEFGPVSANLSYKGWLKRQPKEVRQLVNVKRTYTRAELAALEPITFL